MTTKPEQPPLSIEERVEKAARAIAMWAFDALPINSKQEILIDKECKPILRRHFEDLGGVPCDGIAALEAAVEMWKDQSRISAHDYEAKYYPETHPDMPQIKIEAAIARMKRATSEAAQTSEGVGTPPKQEQNTAAGEPSDSSVTSPSLSNEHPQSDQTTAAAENSSPTISAGGGIDRTRQSNPLCRVEGCGRPRFDFVHQLEAFPNDHEFNNTTERRIGAKERRVWDTGSWASREKRSSLFVPYQRTGPPDRRKPSQDSAIGDETSQRPAEKHGDSDLAPDSHAPRGSAAQPGKKEGIEVSDETKQMERAIEDSAAGRQKPVNPQVALSSHATEPATPAQPRVTAEQTVEQFVKFERDPNNGAGLWAVFVGRTPLHHFTPGTQKPHEYIRWLKLELTAFAYSLLAERDRTIAELRAKSEHYRVEAINQGCKREQAEQERDALKGSTWGAAYEVTQKAVATAERLRGLLREADVILLKLVKDLKTGAHYHAILALRQRIQKELEGRP